MSEVEAQSVGLAPANPAAGRERRGGDAAPDGPGGWRCGFARCLRRRGVSTGLAPMRARGPRRSGRRARVPFADPSAPRRSRGPALRRRPTRVAHLAAGLGVERVLPQDQLDPVVRLAEGKHVGLGGRRVVADELLLPALDGAPGAGLLDVDGRSGRSGRGAAFPDRPVSAPAGSAPPGIASLLLQRPLESGEIHLHPALARNDLGEIDGEPERVVQLEGLFARR